MDRKADMVLTSLKITPKRNEQIEFSIPFLETGITIIVSIRKGAISPTAFLGKNWTIGKAIREGNEKKISFSVSRLGNSNDSSIYLGRGVGNNITNF